MSEENQGLHSTAYQISDGQSYVPFVQVDDLSELTWKSVLTGIVLGVVFGAANAYLGLMAGLTISTSIPIAVLSVVTFSCFKMVRNQPHTILETNMAQTIGSASSSVASGVLFTIPALFVWGLEPQLWQLTILAIAGGIIGVLAMIPLRQFLIKREHGSLPYPEGLACAEVLVASEHGGRQATNVFWGLGAGASFKCVTDALKLLPASWTVVIGKAELATKISPALMGVGFILGPKVATIMVAGSALSALMIIPALAWWGQSWTVPLYPESENLIKDMSPDAMREKYIRYIGAGAVGAAGLLTLLQSLPVMLESFRLGLAQLRSEGSDRSASFRSDSDLSMRWVLFVLFLVLATLIFVPGLLGFLDSIWVRGLAAILIAIFAFFFVTVSSRIVGLVGVTSNPTSGMTIATLLITSLIFLACGWTDLSGKATALMVGTVVCIAASIAGDTSQDLKTGFLLGATPKSQQLGELLGVLTASFFVCLTVVVLGANHGFGSKELPAPQAILMNLVISGVIDQNLPWTLILAGVAITALVSLLRLPALPFAVGVYLPLSTMSAVFLGGLLRWFLTRNVDPQIEAERRKNGILFASGLVGGEGLMGLVIAIIVLAKGSSLTGFPLGMNSVVSSVIAILSIVFVLVLIAQATNKRHTS
ncbi:MAG: oligopeptide transporter, OPT family [Planctomycetales bacterium]|nr:oligopeptide transporter, OPT family [Planctomycetales bacterium]